MGKQTGALRITSFVIKHPFTLFSNPLLGLVPTCFPEGTLMVFVEQTPPTQPGLAATGQEYAHNEHAACCRGLLTRLNKSNKPESFTCWALISPAEWNCVPHGAAPACISYKRSARCFLTGSTGAQDATGWRAPYFSCGVGLSIMPEKCNATRSPSSPAPFAWSWTRFSSRVCSVRTACLEAFEHANPNLCLHAIWFHHLSVRSVLCI